jgi:hypothetical protein
MSEPYVKMWGIGISFQQYFVLQPKLKIANGLLIFLKHFLSSVQVALARKVYCIIKIYKKICGILIFWILFQPVIIKSKQLRQHVHDFFFGQLTQFFPDIVRCFHMQALIFLSDERFQLEKYMKKRSK